MLGDRCLVEYGVLDGAVLAAVVTATSVSVSRLVSLDAIRTQIAKLALCLRALAVRGRSHEGPGLTQVAQARIRSLRAALVEPLRVPPDQELVVVPVDDLQRVPWSAMHDSPVSVSPSASFWASTHEREDVGRHRALLAAGPDLPAAVEEVRELSALHPDHIALLPPHSTVRRITDALPGTGTAHLACHGVVRSDNPLFSSLRFSDGDLTVQELELRNLSPYRVILAACQAAADASLPGGERLGFVSALMARGTAGVLGSIHLVPDTAAAPLMTRVHQELRRGATLSGALSAARAALDLTNPGDFVNWCGFTAYGAA
jgi:CHAT domain-containing protein